MKQGGGSLLIGRRFALYCLYIYQLANLSQELIKVKGNQVAPAELEGLLLEHPSVLDAAVIGIPQSAALKFAFLPNSSPANPRMIVLRTNDRVHTSWPSPAQP